LENGSDNRLYVYDGAAVLAEYAPDPALDPTKAASGHLNVSDTRIPPEATGGLLEAARSLRTTADDGSDGFFKARQYLYGTTLLAAETFDPRSQPPGPRSRFYHLDSLGSTVNLTAGAYDPDDGKEYLASGTAVPSGSVATASTAGVLADPLPGAVTAAYLYDAWGNYRELDVTDPSVPGEPVWTANPDLDENGLSAWEYYLADIQSAFDPSLEARSSSLVWNRLTYSGHGFDPETGLYYFKARFYDPELGRFASEDPYLGDTLTPPSLHRYLYAYASPLRYVDLTGYAPGDWWDPRSYDWAVFAQGVGRRAGALAVGATEESVNLITAGQYKAGKKFVQELARQPAQGASVVDALQQAGAEAAVEWVDNATYGGFRKGVETYQTTLDVGVSVRRGVVEAVYNTGNQVLPVDEYAVLSDPQASLGNQIVAGASGMVKCTALATAAAPVASRISSAVKPSGLTTLFNEGGFVAGPKSSPRPVIVEESPDLVQIPQLPEKGLSSRGYHPAVGERSLTRQEWVAQYRESRITGGSTSSWSVARGKIYKSIGEAELANPSGGFSPTNIARMLESKAPQVRAEIFVHKTGLVVQRNISLELHHRFYTQRTGSALAHEPWNLEMTMPWGHASMDPHRFLGYDLLRIIRGPSQF